MKNAMKEVTWVTVCKEIDGRGLKVEITVKDVALPLVGEIFNGLKRDAFTKELPIRAMNDKWDIEMSQRIISVYPSKEAENFDNFYDSIANEVSDIVSHWTRHKIDII